MGKLVYGVGVNDADYEVASKVNGKRVLCNVYRKWHAMLERCYSDRYEKNYPTYANCFVCQDWLLFSKFRLWMQSQDWKGKELDKDILAKCNKLYCPETCVFVDSLTNKFTNEHPSKRGSWPLGVSFNKTSGRLIAQISNPFTKKQEHLGYFECQNEAHQAWRKRKHELSIQLADMQTDPRVAQALRTRYL